MTPDLPLDILTLDHVAMAAWDLSANVGLVRDVLGGRFVDGGDSLEAGFRWIQFEVGGGKIELMEPLTKDGFLYRFLTRRGEGLHHMTFYVPDLAQAVASLQAAGIEPVDVDLRHASWKEAFLHPRDTSGVLIQLAQTSEGYATDRTLDDFLADRPGLRPD
jgi:methylmalonyl-CoA/ethylmalonyl-CoA epimerase